MWGGLTHCRWSLAITTASVIQMPRASPHSQQCFSPALISSAAATDLSRAVQHRISELPHPTEDALTWTSTDRSTLCPNTLLTPTILIAASPHASSQGSVWPTQSNCTAIAYCNTSFVNYSIHSIYFFCVCAGVFKCLLRQTEIYIIIHCIDHTCISVSRHSLILKTLRNVSYSQLDMRLFLR